MTLQPLKDGYALDQRGDWPDDQTILILRFRELALIADALKEYARADMNRETARMLLEARGRFDRALAAAREAALADHATTAELAL